MMNGKCTSSRVTLLAVQTDDWKQNANLSSHTYFTSPPLHREEVQIIDWSPHHSKTPRIKIASIIRVLPAAIPSFAVSRNTRVTLTYDSSQEPVGMLAGSDASTLSANHDSLHPVRCGTSLSYGGDPDSLMPIARISECPTCKPSAKREYVKNECTRICKAQGTVPCKPPEEWLRQWLPRLAKSLWK